MTKTTDAGTGEFLSVQFDFLDPSGANITADVIFYLVVSGIEGQANNDPPEVFSRMWYPTNDIITTDLDVSMNSKTIEDLKDSKEHDGVVILWIIDAHLGLKLKKLVVRCMVLYPWKIIK